MENEPDDGGRKSSPDRAVWEAVDRFSEALRDLDAELRALAQVFARPNESGGPVGDAPGHVRRSYD